jgi:nucleotide-binding universal stress UspA family protein
MSTIVVGYDASDCARAALRTAIEVARAFGDDVHVVVAYEVHRLGGEVQDFAAALGERAQAIVKLASDQAAGLGAGIQTEIVEERAADALLEVADRIDARMIVVGSRGEGPLRAAIVGSTPHKLMQLAERPLLVVPA